MDAPDADPVELERSLRFIRRANRAFQYTRATLSHLERFSRHWKPGERISMIDVGTGSADVPMAILRWAKRKGFDVHITGIDMHATTARVAASLAQHPRLTIMQADAMNMPFADGTFDYALNSMFLHHLGDDEVLRVLRAMDRVAKRGMVIADLLRHRRAYFWISLFTSLSTPMVRHDAKASIIQAFNREEILALRDRAGLSYLGYYAHFAHRFVLAGEKPIPGKV